MVVIVSVLYLGGINLIMLQSSLRFQLHVYTKFYASALAHANPFQSWAKHFLKQLITVVSFTVQSASSGAHYEACHVMCPLLTLILPASRLHSARSNGNRHETVSI